jgi:hypothetical protein
MQMADILLLYSKITLNHNVTLTSEAVPLFVILNGIQNIADVPNTTA